MAKERIDVEKIMEDMNVKQAIKENNDRLLVNTLMMHFNKYDFEAIHGSKLANDVVTKARILAEEDNRGDKFNENDVRTTLESAASKFPIKARAKNPLNPEGKSNSPKKTLAI